MPYTFTCKCGCLNDPEQFILKFHKRCLKYARSKASKENAEDFASWAVIRFLENGRHHIPYAFVDYMREIIGRTDSPNFHIKYNIYCPKVYSEDD